MKEDITTSNPLMSKRRNWVYILGYTEHISYELRGPEMGFQVWIGLHFVAPFVGNKRDMTDILPFRFNLQKK